MRIILFFVCLLAGSSGFSQNTLGNPSGTVDELTIVEGAQQLLQGSRADNIQASADNNSIELVDGALAGSLTIPFVATRFPFNEAIPSWNGWVGNDGGFRVWMNPILADRSPTSWFDAGTWGRVSDELTTRIIPLNCGIYNIDTLELSKSAQSVSVRFDLVRASPNAPSPKIFMFALSYTNSTGNQQLARQFASPNRPLSRSVQLQVPFRSQVVAREQWIGRICSPASITMGLAHFGINKETQTLASALYDSASDAFGVWHRSIQGASQNGVKGYITRFRNWSDVSHALANGHIVCASIRFRAGEVDDPMVKYGRRKNGTEGHLILITGVNVNGTVTVHDTASKDYGVNSVWNQTDLAKAWFDKGGVAYVLTGPRK